LAARLADPAFYQDRGDEVALAGARLEEIEAGLAASYARWEEIEAVDAAWLAWKNGRQ